MERTPEVEDKVRTPPVGTDKKIQFQPQEQHDVVGEVLKVEPAIGTNPRTGESLQGKAVKVEYDGGKWMWHEDDLIDPLEQKERRMSPSQHNEVMTEQETEIVQTEDVVPGDLLMETRTGAVYIAANTGGAAEDADYLIALDNGNRYSNSRLLGGGTFVRVTETVEIDPSKVEDDLPW